MRLVVAVALLVVFAAAPTMAIRTDYAAVLVGNFTTRVLPVENPTLMFGHDVAMAADANVLAVGECATVGMGGFVHVYEPVGSGGAWVRTAELRSGNSEKDYFGCTISISADASVLVVGAPRFGTGTRVAASSHGRAFVYARNATAFADGNPSYVFSQELALSAPARYDRLGTEVQVTPDGTFVFVMSMFVSCSDGSCTGMNPANRGIHVWRRASATDPYVFEAQVQTSEPSLVFPQSGQTFGAAPDGSALYIKSYDPGYIAENDALANYTHALPYPTMLAVWTRDAAGPTWNEATPIRAPDRQSATQAFATRVVVDPASGEVYASAPRNDSVLFRFDPTTGAALQSFRQGNEPLYDVSGLGNCDEFVQPWKTDGSFFGQDIAISPSSQLMVVGAPFGVDSGQGKGKVYLYTRNVGVSDGVWSLADTFESDHVFSFQPSGFAADGYAGTPYDPAIVQSILDEFGLDVTMNNEYIAIGAKGLDKVYIFGGLESYTYVASPPPPQPPSPPPPPAQAVIIPPQPPSGGSIALALIIGIILILLVLIALFFGARFAIKAYFKRKLRAEGIGKGSGSGSGSGSSGAESDGVGMDELEAM